MYFENALNTTLKALLKSLESTLKTTTLKMVSILKEIAKRSNMFESVLGKEQLE